VYYSEIERTHAALDIKIKWGDYLTAMGCILLSLFNFISKVVMNIIYILVENEKIDIHLERVKAFQHISCFDTCFNKNNNQ